MSLNSEIELYMDKMEKILNNDDMIKKILLIINLDIIKTQKKKKYELNKEIKKFEDIYYKDKRYIIYKNKLNNIARKNRSNNNNSINLKLIKLENNNINTHDINNVILNNINNIIYEKNININDMNNAIDDNIILKNSSNIDNVVIHVKYV